jgi:glutaredoxin-like protein
MERIKPMIQEKDRKQIITIFKALQNDVKIIIFTQEFECDFCRMTRELLQEIKGLSEKIFVEIYDFVKDAEIVKKYNIDKIPATIILGERDYGIRFYGVPAGYEFTSLIEDIVDVSRREPSLKKDVLTELAKVDKPVHIQVLTSPTCPYCALAIRMAHRFAMANDHIVSDMVELTEFPHLAVKYNVQSFPKIVINEDHFLSGLPTEIDFVHAILKAIGK